MKRTNLFGTVGRKLTAVMMTTCCLLALAILPVEQAEASDFYGGAMSPAATLTSVSNATVTATSSTAVALVQNVDLVLSIGLVCTNSGTSNFIAGFNLQLPDGTWTTTTPILTTNACNGTTGTTNFYLISQSSFRAAKAIRWDSSSTTQTNTVSASVRWAQYY